VWWLYGAVCGKETTMNMKIKYLSKPCIEAKAEALLADFGYKVRKIQSPPVPIDDILEGHLGLTLDFDNLEKRFGAAGILEATWIGTREVFVDESLDPEEHPQSEGRYHFTLAHAAGHWELHRSYYSAEYPSFVCAASCVSRSLEFQADYYSSCLLMPRAMVISAWSQRSETTSRTESSGWTSDLALSFGVSASAMQIRLEDIGLIPG